MTIVGRNGRVVTQGAFNRCMAALAESRGRAKQLSEDLDALATRFQAMRKAAQMYRRASIQWHGGHWDRQQAGGANCPECLRADELRREADALMDIANAHALTEEWSDDMDAYEAFACHSRQLEAELDDLRAKLAEALVRAEKAERELEEARGLADGAHACVEMFPVAHQRARQCTCARLPTEHVEDGRCTYCGKEVFL